MVADALGRLGAVQHLGEAGGLRRFGQGGVVVEEGEEAARARGRRAGGPARGLTPSGGEGEGGTGH